MQLPTDPDELWPELEKLGEKKVREMLAARGFEYRDESQVKEWLSRRSAANSVSDSTHTKWAAYIGAVAAVVAAIASIAQLMK